MYRCAGLRVNNHRFCDRYDVWLGNVRGNRFSNTHISLRDSDDHFWEYSFEDHALYDLPATINFVLRHSSAKNVTYIAHSQGTLQMFLGIAP